MPWRWPTCRSRCPIWKPSPRKFTQDAMAWTGWKTACWTIPARATSIQRGTCRAVTVSPPTTASTMSRSMPSPRSTAASSAKASRSFQASPSARRAAPPSGRRRTSGWQGWIVSEDGPSRQQVFAETFLRYLAFEPDDPEFELSDLDFDEDLGRMDFIRSILDATDPDLSRFRDAGGKMLMYFGWADTAAESDDGRELLRGGVTRHRH